MKGMGSRKKTGMGNREWGVGKKTGMGSGEWGRGRE
jgi:hypothetical protein